MSTSERDAQLAWQSWQPQNLLDEHFQPESDISHVAQLDPGSDEKLQHELSLLRQQAEQKGFAQGVARGQEEGKKQGFAAGFAEGKAQGIEQGSAEARAQQSEIAERLARLCEEFRLTLDNLDSIIPSRLVQLALTAARAMLGKNGACDNMQLLENIQRLLQEETLLRGNICLWVSNEDLALVQAQLGERLTSLGWTLHGDAQLLPGGCRVTSEEGEFDATIATRWQALCQLAREDYPA